MSKGKTKPEQQWIDGTKPPHYPDVSKAATAYQGAKEDAASAAEAEKRARAALIEKMKKRGLPSYIDRGIGLRVTLESSDKLKVKKLGKGGAES